MFIASITIQNCVFKTRLIRNDDEYIGFSFMKSLIFKKKKNKIGMAQ